MNKGNLRLHAKRILSSIDTQAKSLPLSKNLSIFLQDYSDCIIGAYAPLPLEPIWDRDLKFIGQISYPRPKGEREMEFALCSSDQLQEGANFGVQMRAPSEDAQVVVPDLILVPGLLFGKRGERLGRGKGFFDQYLSQFSGVSVGMCFEEQLSDLIEMEDHDCWMNRVITDHTIYECDRPRSI